MPQARDTTGGAAGSGVAAEMCVKDMTSAEVIALTKGTAVRMLTMRAGERHDVVGNGTCWLYAAMASIGLLEHGWELSMYTTKTNVAPTERDVRWSEALLSAMRLHFVGIPVPDAPRRGQRDSSDHQDWTIMKNQLQKMNVWVPKMGNKMAVWGGESMLALLARSAGNDSLGLGPRH